MDPVQTEFTIKMILGFFLFLVTAYFVGFSYLSIVLYKVIQQNKMVATFPYATIKNFVDTSALLVMWLLALILCLLIYFMKYYRHI